MSLLDEVREAPTVTTETFRRIGLGWQTRPYVPLSVEARDALVELADAVEAYDPHDIATWPRVYDALERLRR